MDWQDEWKKTEAARLCLKTGLAYTPLYSAIAQTFRAEQFDGSLRQLAEIACGARCVRNIGQKGQQRIAHAFFVHFGIFD